VSDVDSSVERLSLAPDLVDAPGKPIVNHPGKVLRIGREQISSILEHILGLLRFQNSPLFRWGPVCGSKPFEPYLSLFTSCSDVRRCVRCRDQIDGLTLKFRRP